MIELTELIYQDGKEREHPLLINPRYIVLARPAMGEMYRGHEDLVYLIKTITGDAHFVFSGLIGDDPQDWARALQEAA